MFVRGVRGATTVEENTKAAILKASRELLALLIRSNEIEPGDVASVLFSTTRDLDAEFPALAARQFGWMNVPLLCGHEMAVPGSLGRCLRILLHWNTEKTAEEIVHVYIRGAEKLRPDIDALPPVDWDELNTWINDNMQSVRQ